MKNIIHDALSKLDGYLMSIQRNVETGQYELEIGIKNTWVYKSTPEIDCEVLHEVETGKIIKVFGLDDEITLDDLVHFVEKIIQTNKKIVEMEESFQKRLEEQKEILAKQIKEFQDQLEIVKESSFDDEEEEDVEEKKEPKKVDNQLSESEKQTLEENIPQ